MPDLDEMLDTKAVAAMLGVSPTTVQCWRHRGKGPRYLKVGPSRTGSVRYRRGEVARYLRAAEVRP